MIPRILAVTLIALAAVLGAHLLAVLLLVAVIAVCVALAVLTFGIAGVVAESGCRVVPRCAAVSSWRQA